MASNLLGLTVNCARCHSHKYDPIPQADYYRLTAIFTPAFNPQGLAATARSGLGRHRAARAGPPARRTTPRFKSKSTPPNSSWPTCAARTKSAFSRRSSRNCPRRFAPTRRAPRKLRRKTHRRSKVPGREIRSRLARNARRGRRGAQRRGIANASQPWKPKWPSCRRSCKPGARSRRSTTPGPAPATYLLRRGNHDTPGNEVSPGFLSVLCEKNPRELFADVRATGPTSGRRLALARWLTQRDTPAAGQTARVIVNRMWQQLFRRRNRRDARQFRAFRRVADAPRTTRLVGPTMGRRRGTAGSPCFGC